MKKLFLLTVMFLFTYTIQAQQRIDVSNVDNTHLVELEDGLYKVIIKCDEGKLRQVGYYKEHIDGSLVKQGLWKMYSPEGKWITKAEYKDDQLVWIQPRGGDKYSRDVIRIKQLQRRVITLENRLANVLD